MSKTSTGWTLQNAQMQPDHLAHEMHARSAGGEGTGGVLRLSGSLGHKYNTEFEIYIWRLEMAAPRSVLFVLGGDMWGQSKAG